MFRVIFESIRNNNIGQLKSSIDDCTYNHLGLDGRNEEGLTALMFAAQQGNFNAVIELLKGGANPSEKSNKPSQTQKKSFFPQNQTPFIEQTAAQMTDNEEIKEILNLVEKVRVWDNERSKYDVDFSAMLDVLKKNPGFLKAKIRLDNKFGLESYAQVIARQEITAGKENQGYQSLLSELAADKTRKAKGTIKFGFTAKDLDWAIRQENLPLIKILIKGGVVVERDALESGLRCTNREIQFYFKKHFNADKVSSRYERNNNALDNAINQHEKRVKDNKTTFKDLLSVGFNPLNLSKWGSMFPSFFNLKMISEKRLDEIRSMASAHSRRKKERADLPGLVGVCLGMATFVALALTLTLPLPIFGAINPLLQLAAIYTIPCLVGVVSFAAARKIMSYFSKQKKNEFEGIDSFTDNYQTLQSWKLVEELAPHYANDYINTEALIENVKNDITKKARNCDTVSTDMLHGLFNKQIVKAKNKLTEDQKEQLLGKYKESYEAAFKQLKKDSNTTASGFVSSLSDQSKKDLALKEGTLTWTFELAKYHAVDKNKAAPKLESKSLKKLRVA